MLIGGRRREIIGTITMDQLMVDCGDDDVAAGDEVVLLGRQGSEEIRAEEWARTLGTIGYEIVCGIGARVPRRYVTRGALTGIASKLPMSLSLSVVAPSLAETHAVAGVVARRCRAGDIVALGGEMGAGKTAFAKGFGKALGVAEPITSPTFTLVQTYATPVGQLHHADIYRLEQLARARRPRPRRARRAARDRPRRVGDVVSASLGDHLEVRLDVCDDEGTPSTPPTPPQDSVAASRSRRRPSWRRWDALTLDLAAST